ncbi:11758_t:CDS:2, partial [Racocetra fulgida]
MSESNSLLNGSTDLQDLLMCESYIDDIMATINNLSTTQSSTETLPEFEAQIQSMFANNNTKDSSSSQLNDLSLNDFQYPVPSSDMLSLGSPKPFLYLPDSTSFDNICPESMQYSLTSNNNSAENICSQETFLFSPNSADLDNISSSNPLYYSPNSSEISAEDISSSDTLSPLNYTLFQDLNSSPTNTALAEFGSYSSPMENTFDALLSSGFNLDPVDIQPEYNRKRVSLGYDSVSSDESSKKKRKGANGTVKSVKKTNPYPKSIKKIGSNKHGTNSDTNTTFEEDSLPSKSPVIDVDTIKAILASLSDTANRTIEPFGANLIQDKQDEHSDEEDAVYDKSTPSNTKSSTATSQPQKNSKPQTNKQQKKLAHNVIERRYRNNINDRINDLKNVVPALCHLKSKDDDVIEEVDGIPAATKTNKATILRKATEYIVYLKKNNDMFKDENDVLKKIILTIPGGVDLLEAYLTNLSDMKTPPDTPPSETNALYKHRPSTRNSGSRALMALFMCVTFLTDPSKNAQPVRYHHNEGHVIVSNTTESVVPDGIYNSQGDADERLLEVELWNRLGEIELCGAVSHFWNLAIKEKGHFNSEEKWLEIALISVKNHDIWESAANRICDHVFNLSKSEETLKPIISTNIPLVYVSEVQALYHIKEAFSNLISERQGTNKILKGCQFTFSELLSVTTPASLMHWYALVGCVVQAFHEGKNDSGTKLVNKLRDELKTNDNLDKRIITMGLLSRSLLICGNIESSIHCADKAVNYISLRKNEKKETLETDKDLVIGEIVNDVHDLAEFCVGWIILETRIVGLGIIGHLLSKNKNKPLSNVFDEKHLRSSIDIWARYLRRSSKSNVFDSIPKSRERFIRKLDLLGRIISGIDDNDYGYNCDYDKQNTNEYKATRALHVLKG